MKTFICSASVMLLGLLPYSTAHAQHHHHHNHYVPGYHIDHHDHVIRDSHGHIIGRYHHDVVHSGSSYILPHSGNHHHGTYYVNDGGYFYHPNSSGLNAHTVQPVAIEFGGFSHVDDLASRLEMLTNEFCLDLHYNYSHNPGFAGTYAEAYEILQIAKFIHAAEHQHDRQAIAERLGGVDQLFHHVQDDVRDWTRHQHRQIGHLGIVSKMDLIESTLHHLMNDVGVALTPDPNEQAPPPGGVGGEQAPPPGAAGAPVPGGAAPGPVNSPVPGSGAPGQFSAGGTGPINTPPPGTVP